MPPESAGAGELAAGAAEPDGADDPDPPPWVQAAAPKVSSAMSRSRSARSLMVAGTCQGFPLDWMGRHVRMAGEMVGTPGQSGLVRGGACSRHTRRGLPMARCSGDRSVRAHQTNELGIYVVNVCRDGS